MFRFTLKSASAAVAAVLLSAPNSPAEDEAPPTHLPDVPAAPVVPVVPVAPIVPPAPWPVAFPDLFAPLAPAPVLVAPLDPPAPLDPVALPAEAPAVLPPAALPEPQPVAPVAPCPCEGGFDWKKVPRVRPMPRLGYFPVLPTGPGYYSALDQLRGVCLNAPPKYPYPRFGVIPMSFFDVDNFSYLDDPNNTEHDFFDPLKRVRLGNNWLFTTGGEFRWRYENAYNDRLGQRDNSYDLTRTRIYGDLWYRDAFRLYVEYIGAWSAFQDLPPLPIDQNKSDFLNLFVDLKLADLGGDPAYLRIGRQELLFGSQRLISPLDWANTRRTFQGVRGFRHTDNWDFDLFWVQPVAINANRFDSVDNNQNFVGAWATYRPNKAQAIDAYYLMLDNTNVVTQLGIPRGNFTRHTIGGRYSGTGQNNPNVLFDSETAFQFGSQNGRDVFAAMTAQGLGYNWKDAPWNPTFWAYYDYASGGRNGAGTFNQLFPFGHYYLGWIDQVGRQNIHDLNFHLYLYPTKWVTAWTQFHSFWLADARDALYNAAGNAIRRDPTGRAGQHVGEELDFVLNFHLSKHADLLTGYCHLWGGDFLHNTASRTNAQNAGLYFLQLGYRW